MKIKTAKQIIDKRVLGSRNPDILVHNIEQAMKEFAAQFIDLAAEVADLECTDGDVDRETILNVKKQIK